MGRQDAQRSVQFQNFSPWDAETAPPTPRKLEANILRAALLRWERERGLSVSLRDMVEAETREAMHRRKLLSDELHDSEEE